MSNHQTCFRCDRQLPPLPDCRPETATYTTCKCGIEYGACAEDIEGETFSDHGQALEADRWTAVGESQSWSVGDRLQETVNMALAIGSMVLAVVFLAFGDLSGARHLVTMSILFLILMEVQGE